MRFQCGTCGKYYLIESAEQIKDRQMLRCTECGNTFLLRNNYKFSSSSRNSKLICERCGGLIEESADSCVACNPDLKKLREDFLIDNREYNFFVVRKGKIRPKYSNGSGKTKKIVLLVGIALFVAGCLFLFLPGGKRDALKNTILQPLGITSRTETQLVIMRSGQTYYAEKVEKKNGTARITEKSGKIVTIAEKDILQIAKAVTEQ